MEMFRSLSSKKKRSKRSKVTTASSLTLETTSSSSFDQPEPRTTSDKLRFSWVKSESLDYGIFCGQCAAWESTIYFKNGGSDEVYEYSIRTDSWVRLVSPPYRGSALVVIDGLVTSVGGHDSVQQDQEKLVSLMDGKWSECYPAMPTARHYAMATMLGHTLIVAGGCVKNNVRVGMVEVMDVNERAWLRVADLPVPLSSSHFAVCEDQVYLVGGFNSNGDAVSTVLCCNGRALLGQTLPSDSERDHTPKEGEEGEEEDKRSTEMMTTPILPATPTPPATPTSSPFLPPSRPCNHHHRRKLKRSTTTPTQSSSPWQQLSDTPPITMATSCIVNQQLVILGGMKSSKRPSGEIYRYEPQSTTWEVVGALPTARYCSSAAALQHGELMVVGGVSGQPGSEVMNLLEVATF